MEDIDDLMNPELAAPHQQPWRSPLASYPAPARFVHNLGSPEALQWEEVEVGEPGDGEIRIRNTAIGVNFIDIYFRKGVFPASLPFTTGTVLPQPYPKMDFR
ncbi:hypothetical protein ZWY2020_041801 [Hordeum vulgare]|nr:hypothetical protein ZWY2020_041801 [Hordeum vulgare]